MAIIIDNFVAASKPARIKTIPPTISCFQDIATTAVRMRVGILCINRPIAICWKFESSEKTSNDNIAKNRMNIIDKTLGAQYRYLLMFFFICIYL